jgi:hypothetical protein
MFNVKLVYFRESGKYYDDGEYDSHKEHIHEIFEEVEDLSREGKLPGFVAGHNQYHVLIDVPDHPHRHPALITIDRINMPKRPHQPMGHFRRA